MPSLLSAQAMAVSEVSTTTLNRIGTDTQTRGVTTTVQLAPSAAVSQLTLGDPWQAMTAVPVVTSGVNVSVSAISTHCVPVLLHPLAGQLSAL